RARVACSTRQQFRPRRRRGTGSISALSGLRRRCCMVLGRSPCKRRGGAKVPPAAALERARMAHPTIAPRRRLGEFRAVEGGSAIEPSEALVPIGGGFGTHDRVAQMRVRGGGVIDMLADGARLELDAGGAQEAAGLIGL